MSGWVRTSGGESGPPDPPTPRIPLDPRNSQLLIILYLHHGIPKPVAGSWDAVAAQLVPLGVCAYLLVDE